MRQVYLKYLKNALFLALCFAKTIFNFHALSVHTFSASSQLGYMLCYTLNWVYECTHKALNLSLAFDVDAFFSLVSLKSRGNWLHGARITREAHIKALNPCNQLFTCFVNPAQGSTRLKQSLSLWIMHTITPAFSARRADCLATHTHILLFWEENDISELFKWLSLRDVTDKLITVFLSNTFIRYWHMNVRGPINLFFPC